MFTDMMIYVEVPHSNDSDVDLFKFADLQQATNYLMQNDIESFTLSSNDARNMMYEPDDYTNMTKEAQ